MNADYMPIIVCNADNTVVLSELCETEILKNIKVKDGITDFLTNESKALISDISNGEYALAELHGIGKYKYAIVKNQIYLGFKMNIFLLLSYGVTEIAELVSALNIPEIRLSKKVLSAVNKRREDGTAFSDGEIYERYVKISDKLDWCGKKLSFSKIISESCRFVDFMQDFSEFVSSFYLNGCSLKIVYGEGIKNNLLIGIESSAFYTVMLLLISLASGESCNKEIILHTDYFENQYVFKVSTEIENKSGELYRGREIYDFNRDKDINSQMAAVCARLFGASNAKLSKSVDGADGKYILSFECVKKEYEKMPAGVKTDTDIFDTKTEN